MNKDRERLKAELLEELFAHSPAAVMRYMRNWPGGALSLVHLNVMTVLDADGAMPMGHLADALDVSQASATGIVDRMEQRGLITRQRDPDDRRVTRVALTDEGRGVISGLATERREKLSKLLDELSDDELDGFLRGVRAMRLARERHFADLTSEVEARK